MRPTGIAVALVLAIALQACRSPDVRFGAGALRIRTRSGVVALRVEVADTAAGRERGLMGRRRLAPDGGMAFVFDRPTSAGFWMKDTLIPLDIAFWTRGGRIVAILHMTPCRHDPCPMYSPGRRYTGAVEASGGFFAGHGVRTGDRVRLSRLT